MSLEQLVQKREAANNAVLKFNKDHCKGKTYAYPTVDEMINAGIASVTAIYRPSEEQRNKFIELWSNNAFSELADGSICGFAGIGNTNPLYGFTAGGNKQSNNIGDAVVGAGIADTTLLPENYSHPITLTPVLPETIDYAKTVLEYNATREKARQM